MIEFLKTYQNILWCLTIVSALLFFLSLILIPWLLIRIPDDYFICRKSNPFSRISKLSFIQILILIIKNLLGLLLLICGVAMLLLPGQGILTILLSITLVDFPHKRRFELWLISRPMVLNTVNRLRKRAGTSPLKIKE
jgi:hypothetical protein